MTILTKLACLSASCLMVALGMPASSGAAPRPASRAYHEVAVPNSSFEQPADGSIIPDWTFSFGSTNHFSVVSADAAPDGASALHIVDPSSNQPQGLLSAPVRVTHGLEYAAQAHIQLTTGSTQLYLYFYDSAGRQLASSASPASAATPYWTGMAVSATAPDRAITARVLVYSSSTAVTDGYVDDVRLVTGGVLDRLGEPVHNTPSKWRGKRRRRDREARALRRDHRLADEPGGDRSSDRRAPRPR